MKTLQNKVIIYDDVCPLCKAYTKGFVQLGWLLPHNRLGFSAAPPDLLANIDLDRARHEIPLYDRVTGETLYGKDALFFILGEALPLMKPLFRFGPFRGLVFGLYQIITYNRRIIAGSRKPELGFDCAPNFHPFYRWLYIALTLLGATLLLINTYDNFAYAYWPAFAFLLGAGFLQAFRYTGLERLTGYIGHLATVMLIAALSVCFIGWNAVTVVLIPALAVWLFAKRIALV